MKPDMILAASPSRIVNVRTSQYGWAMARKEPSRANTKISSLYLIISVTVKWTMQKYEKGIK